MWHSFTASVSLDVAPTVTSWLVITWCQLGKPPAFTQDTRIRKQYILDNRKWTVIRATTFPQFMEQFCSLIKTRLQITANLISDEGIRMDSESPAKLSTNCWCWRVFFIICRPNRRNSTLSSFLDFFLWGYPGNLVQFVTVPAFLASSIY